MDDRCHSPDGRIVLARGSGPINVNDNNGSHRYVVSALTYNVRCFGAVPRHAEHEGWKRERENRSLIAWVCSWEHDAGCHQRHSRTSMWLSRGVGMQALPRGASGTRRR
jgi:hypothetical protein